MIEIGMIESGEITKDIIGEITADIIGEIIRENIEEIGESPESQGIFDTEQGSVVNVELVNFGLYRNLGDTDVKTRIYPLRSLNSDEMGKQIKSRK